MVECQCQAADGPQDGRVGSMTAGRGRLRLLRPMALTPSRSEQQAGVAFLEAPWSCVPRVPRGSGLALQKRGPCSWPLAGRMAAGELLGSLCSPNTGPGGLERVTSSGLAATLAPREGRRAI